MLDSASVAALLKDFLVTLAEPLTDEDARLLVSAKDLMREHYQHGFHQLATCATDADGVLHEGLQMDTFIGQNSTCAEVFVIHSAARTQVELTTAVTVRGRQKSEAGTIHVVTPCSGCCERYWQFFPELRVLVWLNSEVRKLPIRALLGLVYKQRVRSDGNGAAGHQFTS